MTSEELARLDRIFQRARRATPAERDALVAAETAGDPALRREIEALLRAHDGEDGDDPLADPALGSGFSLTGEAPLPEVAGYRVLSILGEGGMGTVYLAEQAHPRRRVALKRVRGGSRAPEHLRRFRREAEALAQLHHPGIAQVFAAGEDRGVPFLAMEFVEGATLLDFVREQALSRDARLQLFCRVADAVHHAHLRGVIHRDLKPGNILVEGTWPRAWPKVVDFGVARVLQGDAATLHTRAGELLGTVQYMSPEQARGDTTQVDARTDVYALGVILFELLTERRPHDLADRSVVDAARVLQDEEPARLGSVDPSLRGPLDAVVSTALARDPADRYPSARALADDVRRYLHHEPVSATEASAVDVARRFARRHRSFLIGAAAVTLSSLLGLVAAVQQWRGAAAARDAERAAKETAERRFDDLHDLAHAFVFDFHDQVVALPGSLPARRFLVSKGLEYLDRLAAEGPLAGGLARELAAAYTRLGDIQGAGGQRNLGDIAGARASYERALAILEADGRTDTPSARSDRVAVRIRLGDIASRQGDHEQALALYRSCEPLIAAGQAPTGPGELAGSGRGAAVVRGAGVSRSTTAPRDAGNLAARIGTALHALGRDAEARAAFARALEDSRARYEADPGDEVAARDHATDVFKVALRDLGEGRHDEALQGFLRYFELVEALAAADPRDPIRRRDLAVGHERVADALIALGRHDEAEPRIAAAVALQAGIAGENPDDRLSRHELAGYRIRLGELALRRGDDGAAELLFRAALENSEALAEETSDDGSLRRRRAVARYKMAELARARRAQGSRDREERGALVTEEREWLEQARDELVAMRDEGLLPPGDAASIEELSGELEALRDAEGAGEPESLDDESDGRD